MHDYMAKICVALCDEWGTVNAQRETQALSLSVAFFRCYSTFDDIFLCISSQPLPGE